MAANVLIDVEVLYYLSRNEPPFHRYLHTYLGGSLAGLIAGLLMFGIMLLFARLTPNSSRWKKRLNQTSNLRLLSQSLLAGLLGGLSHVLLDSLMHHEMNPLWPFALGNTFAGSITVAALHIALGLLGLFAMVLWIMLRERE